ncbi:hypothetical protein AFE_2460 [Acidithiobacillus ferrooxidans ATCC 23270]|uniref:Uncharacterized protein n=1 Tax=Acidithiobacillus ferrooxidans (strain ATCC 23270 / DSM 14882 / CIP 104768 / NCIMB 8455) TaxID=243159 RepID=B7J6Z6_ACIF2|nr:hypothetical protein AFE_2460 [Acidithiobacillus ferrooxidans ATCC 23270]
MLIMTEGYVAEPISTLFDASTSVHSNMAKRAGQPGAPKYGASVLHPAN